LAIVTLSCGGDVKHSDLPDVVSPAERERDQRERAKRAAAAIVPCSALFEGEKARALVSGVCAPHPVAEHIQDVWTPDAETIRGLDMALPTALQDAINRATPERPHRPSAQDYFRQYGGLVVNGRRIIYINGFHRRYLEHTVGWGQVIDWRHEVVRVCDGWISQFGAEYDPATRKIQNIMFGGIA
jgi:hypothetical protein